MRNGGTWNGYLSFLIPAIYLCALLMFSLMAVGIGLSASTSFDDESSTKQSSLFFDPKDPQIFIKRGEHSLERSDFVLAAENFERAVELRPGDFDLWQKLGSARSRVGDDRGADAAFQEALRLAPNYAEPNRQMGLWKLHSGDDVSAFEYLRKAAEADGFYYGELLEIARGTYGTDAEAIERAAWMEDKSKKTQLARSLIEHGLLTDRIERLLLGDELNAWEKDEFIGLLISQKKTKVAYEIWASKPQIAGAKPTGGEKIFDGSFEDTLESESTGFGWHIEQKLSGAAVSLTSSGAHHGSRSLRVQYKGDVDPGTKILSQLVPVEPNKVYRLRFAALSGELTSGALPLITITTDHEPLAASSSIGSTGGKWSIITVEFRSGSGDTVLVALERSKCQSVPCPIFGDLSLDDISMIEVG